jgi:hypothetical protein
MLSRGTNVPYKSCWEGLNNMKRITSARLVRAGISLTVAVLGMSLIGAAPANAAAPTPPPAPGTVCWLDLSDGSYQCFDDDAAFQAAVVAQTGAPLLHAGTTSGATSGTTHSASPLPTAATYLLGTMYIDQGWSGGALNLTTQFSNLCATHAYVGNSMPAGWDNVVSSFKSYGTCKTSLSSAQNLGGTTTAPQVNLAWLGIMNDSTSSYRIAQ